MPLSFGTAPKPWTDPFDFTTGAKTPSGTIPWERRGFAVPGGREGRQRRWHKAPRPRAPLVAGAAEDPRVLSHKDMCLVFCAFASWAVKTSDLQAPDAWKTSTYSAGLERGGKGSGGCLAGRKAGIFIPAAARGEVQRFPAFPKCFPCFLSPLLLVPAHFLCAFPTKWLLAGAELCPRPWSSSLQPLAGISLPGFPWDRCCQDLL